MANDIQQVKSYAQQLIKIAQSAQQSGTSIKNLQKDAKKLNDTLNELERKRARSLYTGADDIEELDRLLSKFEGVSTAAKRMGYTIRKSFEQIKAQAPTQFSQGFRGSGFFKDITDVQNIIPKDLGVQVSGSRRQFQDLFKGGGALDLRTSLELALSDMQAKYKGMDVSLANLKPKLDAVNKAWNIQADVIKETAEGITYLRKEQARYRASSKDFEELPQTSARDVLETKLGPRRLEQFKQRINEMGLSMEHLQSASTDAVNGVTRFSFRSGQAGEAVSTATFHFDRFGRALGDTSTRFRAFDDMITRNIAKVAQWGISVGIVFGAFSKAQELLDTMINLEDEMADLAITTGTSSEAINSYFDNIATVAREVGVDVTDSMDAVNKALQIGGTVEGMDRFAAGMQIFEDATKLARLAELDMTESTDILTSSLRQLGSSLTSTGDELLEGEQLLDRWVAVSKEAQVSLEALGKGFATTSAAAAGAGVNVDELTAYIATMAETTNLSAQQSANSLRSLFATIRQPKARKALSEFGIAVEDVIDGGMRELPEILEEIYTRFQTGIIDERELGKIASALGGSRRKAQIEAFIRSYDRSMQLMQTSTNAQGDAQEALGKKTDTLRQALKELNNSFKSLGQTLGNEGGFIDFLTDAVDSVTALVDALNNLIDVLGPTATALAGVGSAWALGREFAIPQRLGFGSGTIGAGALANLSKKRQYSNQVSMSLGERAKYTGLKTLNMAGPGLAVGATHLAKAAMGREDLDQAAGRFGGSVVGAILGGLVGGPGGSLVGAAIAEAFVGYVQKSGELQDLLQKDISGASREELVARRAELKQRFEEVTKPGGGGLLGFAKNWVRVGRLVSWNSENLEEYQQNLGDIEGGLGKLMTVMSTLSSVGFGGKFARKILGIAPPEIAQVEEMQEVIRELNKEITELEGQEIDFGFGASKTQKRYLGYQQQFEPGLMSAFEEEREEMPFEFASGEIESASAYNNKIERMTSLVNQMLPIWDAYTRSAEANNSVIQDAASTYTQIGTEMADWSDENVQFITDQALAIAQYDARLEDLRKQLKEVENAEKRAALAAEQRRLEQQRALAVEEFKPILDRLRQETQQAQFGGIPGYSDFSELTQKEFDQVLAKARELQTQFAEELGIPDSAFEDIEKWAALAGENFQWVEDVMKQFVDAAKTEFKDLKSSQEDAFNVKRLQDVDPSKMGEIARRNRYWVEYLSRLRGQSPQQYLQEEGEQFNLLLGENNTLQRLYSTNQAMLFTLQDIKETEEKQLEGMWNIPSGSRFWVPLTSMFYQEGEGGGYPELPELQALQPPTEQTAQNTEMTTQQLAESLGISQTQAARLQEIIAVLREQGYTPPPAQDWDRQGALTLIDKFEDPWEEVFTGMQSENPLGQFLVESDIQNLANLGDYVSEGIDKMQAGSRHENIPQPRKEEPDWMREQYWHPGDTSAQPQRPDYMVDDAMKVTPGGGWENIFQPGAWTPPDVEEDLKKSEGGATGFTEALNKITALWQQYIMGPEQGGKKALHSPAPQQPQQVKVDIPDMQGNFTIQNTVTLDGRVIATYVKRVLERALISTLRSDGNRTGTR